MKHLIFFTVFLVYAFQLQSQSKNGWTIMHYAAGSNSSEIDLLNDVKEMMLGKTSEGYDVILLIDRTEGHSEDSTTLGENFTDTRLYRITENNAEELNGQEFLPELQPKTSADLNMGDAEVLKRFIQYCKTYHPAEKYMLVLRSHGNGVGMCPDAENGTPDKIYPAEMTQVLGSNESVDLLGLDVCSMAGLENLYQWRPRPNKFSANYVIASAPLSGAWAYDKIFERLQVIPPKQNVLDNNYFGSGQEQYLNPKTMSRIDFATLILEETYDSQRWASWAVFDNGQIAEVKKRIDVAARLLSKEKNWDILSSISSSLGYHHNTNSNEEISLLAFPYVDAFDFWKQISENSGLQLETQKQAKKVCSAIANLVVHSYYGTGFLPETNAFEEGKGGVYQILPQGNRVFSQSNRPFWSHTSWFHPYNQQKDVGSYGLYDWCIDGATPDNNKIENFYELLDATFEDPADSNGYNW